MSNFIHGLNGGPYTVGGCISFQDDCDDYASEAWERMTYGGVNGVDSIPYSEWRGEFNALFRSWAYRRWGQTVGKS